MNYKLSILVFLLIMSKVHAQQNLRHAFQSPTVVNAARFIPNHQICIIPNTTHTVFLENFAAVWASIVPFLEH